ncbi:alpha/beta hydrolase [Mucilaginibacter pallidiroseus]|uniref:Alpha/beta hydrolase n=1 Tax=Mucilaginibacter pallidiroseus TaxID=2599295 RepID=A0A563U508_9SPHI|nr:alpha/beta hydrolase [Mucilaginibacter pallidiroseus]TWR26454.1 alpha/beta hydrolase [Mucilaginibacter pallidiroseus]
MKKFALVIAIVLSVVTLTFAQSTPETYYISFDGTKIYYEVQGSGYPVVLVHGFTNNSQSWKRGKLYQELLNHGYKVIIMDLRGNGRSGKPHTDAAYSNGAEAKDVMGLVSSLGIKRYAVVGYSRGSIITSRIMVLDKRVNKAVMGGMGANYTNPNWPRRIHAYEALMGDTTHHDVDEMMGWIHRNNFDNTALAYQQKHQPSTSAAELGKLRIPVLLIDGTEDDTNGDVTILQKMIPGSKLINVPGNHDNAGNSIQFSTAVLNFLK